ncbi:ATP-binding protein [Anaerosalibacter sp. Marseille-P3206]|uniref:ATP-binding protein n=1 Tax=Anaerosalibacter sp. Marseille-P3206 TaxID=1871005 RepID=UPI00098444E7|nr:AAA family ATPase [Anaerosalibacter sp. Marseille-P3206]
MKIKELNLISFGKYENKVVNLTDGINLIYGENESGKTTIHKFIEGMFFGFFKPYSKRRLYTDEYEKYYPWNRQDYRGVLKFEYEGEIYRLERNFVKGSDELKIYDDKTGEDITRLFDYDSTLRLHSLDSQILGLNSVVYNNTVSIKQLGSKTDENLAKEVKDSLINMGGSLDEDISVKNALAKLNNEINSIGTAGQKKSSPYGQTVEKINKLCEERNQALNYIDQIKAEELECKKLKDELNELMVAKKDIETDLEIIKKIEIKERYEESLRISKEIQYLTIEMDKLKKYSGLDFEKYKRLNSLEKEKAVFEKSFNEWNEQLRKVNERQKNLQTELKKYIKYRNIDEEEFENIVESYKLLYNNRVQLIEIEEKLNALVYDFNDQKDNKIIDIVDDIYKYEELEEERNSILFNKDFSNSNYIKTRLEEKSSELKKKNTITIISLIFTFVSTTLGFVNKAFFIVAAFFLVLFIYIIYSRKEMKEYVKKLNDQVIDIEAQEADKYALLKKIESDMELILEKYNCSNKVELKKLQNKNYERSINYKNRFETKVALQNEKDRMLGEIVNLENILNNQASILIEPLAFNLEDIKTIEKEYLKSIELLNTKEKLDEEEKYIINKITSLKNENSSVNDEIENILKEYDFISIKEMEEGLKYKEIYDGFVKDLENKKILLNNILGNNNLDQLKKAYLEGKSDMSKELNIEEKDKLIEKAKNVEEFIGKIKLEITRIEERINGLGNNFRPIVEMDEDLLVNENKRLEYDERLKSLEIAKDTIENISKNIQRDFAPTLNEKVSNIINTVTDGRYSEVKINENIDVSVVDPDSNILINIEDLSGGTIDQIYFATRFGITDIILDDSTPLLLDDCFVQYDNKRLKNILKVLVKTSNSRQVILFTCHTREKELLDMFNAEYEYIVL